LTGISGNSSARGILQGSEPFAIYPSVRRITGDIYFIASLEASLAISKQSVGFEAARTATGASPFLPYKAWRR